MASLEELRSERLRKLELLREGGMDPFPAHTNTEESIGAILLRFEDLLDSADKIWVGGRITALRSHGSSTFCDIDDGSARVQLFFKRDELGDVIYDFFIKTIDIGDFIEIRGSAFLTKREERSFLVHEWQMLTKSLRPLPEKWHGIEDPDERLRKRYLDLFLSPEKREMFHKKALFWDTVRAFMKGEGFVEVETPTLEVTTGGAEAAPFITHHNDFDMPVYMRISIGELWQKRLMAAGFQKTFEIGKAYRNEGSSPDHLQEFTNMEFYWAYADYDDGMKLVERLYRYIAETVFGTTVFEARGHSFDLAHSWPRIEYVEEIKRQTGIDVLEATEDEIKAKLEELKVVYTGDNRERLMDTLWKYCRKSIAGPAFLVGHPKLVSPLAKARKDNPLLTERFQPLIAGSELGNGFSELNDPLDQQARFELQQELIDRGDEEAMMPDWEFVEMLEHGMPPTCGFGFGERLFSFFMNLPIRETQLFPLTKPKI